MTEELPAMSEQPQLGSRPRYRQIFDILRSRIHNGEYPPGYKLPTEAELMQHFNVSRTTVSRAMRDMELLGLIARRRGSGTYVRKAVDIPERIELAFFVPWIETGAGLPYVEGLILQHLADMASRGQAVLTLQCLAPGPGSLRERMLDAARAVVESEVNGVLYYPAELPDNEMHLNREVLELLVKGGIQVVLVDRDITSYPDRSEFTRIGYDNRRGGMLLTRHLLQVGCRRIAFIGIPEVSTAVSYRLSGYCEAHRVAGMQVDPKLVREADEEDLTEEFCHELMKSQPDAIIGKMDRYAAILGRHLMKLGYKIGSDVKLAGFDDDPIAELLPVPLTTIRLPIKEFAHAAFETILRKLVEPKTDAGQIIIDIELMVRGSTVQRG